MKKIILLFMAVAGLTVFQSCEGPDGPPGPPGTNEVAVYQVKANLTPQDGYGASFDFSQPLLDSDMLLMYRLDGLDQYGDNVWRLLPQTYYLPGEEIDYNFDFTKYDFVVFLESTSPNPEYIDNGRWTKNQVFRAVVLEGYFGDTKRIATLDSNSEFEYHNVVKNYNIKDSDVINLK